MTFAENLQRSREEAGLSQMDLCRQSGISIDSLRNWEQGRVLPRVDAAARLARTLGISLDVLVEGLVEVQQSLLPRTIAPTATGQTAQDGGSRDASAARRAGADVATGRSHKQEEAKGKEPKRSKKH